MSRAVDSKSHKCSCGRSFRHAVSLRRHREVSGCGEHSEDLAADRVDTAAAKEIAEVAAFVPNNVANETVVSPTILRDTEELEEFAPTFSVPSIDWSRVADDTMFVLGRLYGAREYLTSSLRGVLSTSARVGLFLSVLFFSGWFVVSSASAQPVQPVAYQAEASQLAAESVIESFLENAELHQYHRAHDLLTPSARTTVTPNQLALMLSGLPLAQSPERWSSELTDDGQQARVTITRGGANEVYTLVNRRSGWGLASIAVSTART